jgi:Hemerythrin HHE cation binding domain
MEPQEIVSWLSALHLRILSIFDEMDVTDDWVPRRRLARHLAEELRVHADVEERLLYPSLQHVSGDAGEWMQQACSVHLSIESVAHELLTTDFSAERLQGFRNMVARCLNDEQTRIFPSLAALDEARTGELERRLDAYERDREGARGERLISNASSPRARLLDH